MSESLANLSAALVAASAEMPAVAFDATNPFLHNRFASLGSVIATARPILARHGLAVMQFACSDTTGNVGVRTRLLHISGEYVEETVYLPLHEEKGKSKAQVAGSIITYLRRYAQSALLNLYADEDTDGNAPAGDSTHRPAQKTSTPAAPPKAPTTGAAAQGEAKGSASPNPQACKDRFLEIIREKKWEPFAWKLAVDEGAILPTERLDEAKAMWFPQTKIGSDEKIREIKAVMDAHSQGGISQELAEAFDAAYLELPVGAAESDVPDTNDDDWKYIAVPQWSKHFKEGFKTFGDLDDKQLWWWAVKWQPTGYKGKPPKKEDVELRRMLDSIRSLKNFTE